MSGKRKDFYTNLLIGLAVSAVLTVWNPQGAETWLHRACNGLFVTAVLLLGVGGLWFCRNGGTFDVMGYGIKSVFHTHFPGASIGNARDTEDFEAYAKRKAEKRRSSAGILWAGLVYLILAVLAQMGYSLQG